MIIPSVILFLFRWIINSDYKVPSFMGNFINSILLAFVLRKHIIPLQSFTSFKSYYVSNSNLRFLFKEFYSKSRIFELFIIYFAYILISLLFNL